jgi:acetolactate synthase-1/2/3 large subunit
MAAAQLADVRHLILAGARLPVSFFAYPGKPSELHPAGSVSYDIGGSPPWRSWPTGRRRGAGDAGAGRAARPTGRQPHAGTDRGRGRGTAARGAIVADEAITSGRSLAPATAGCPPHDWLR